MEDSKKVRYGTGIIGGFGITAYEQLPHIREAGFESFFSGWSRDKKGEPQHLAELGAKLGLFYETVHAPFSKMNSIWVDGLEGDGYCDMLLDCIDDAAEARVGIVVTHVTVASVAPPPSEIGLTRFRALAEHAAARGVKLALENLEIPEHLEFLFKKLEEYENVGFCWDTGHNLCYTPEIDMMKLYGDRLLCLHINDNKGITTPGVITWHDDSHLMPFDGYVDWQGVADRLDSVGWSGIMNQELSRGKDHCEKLEKYAAMNFREFLDESLARLRRISGLRRDV